jgi:hypothetical protein
MIPRQQIGPRKIESLGLEDHGLRSHAALKSAIARSRDAAWPDHTDIAAPAR